MSKPFFLVQLTDTHIGAPLGNPQGDLAAAVEAIRGLPDQPDAVGNAIALFDACSLRIMASAC